MIIHFELLPTEQLVRTDVYYPQLEILYQSLGFCTGQSEGKIFQHANAHPHALQITAEKLDQLEWEVFSHFAFSADFTLSDYHLLCSWQNCLTGKRFHNIFQEKFPEFHNSGIKKLPKHWTEVIKNNGNYIVEYILFITKTTLFITNSDILSKLSKLK